MASDRYTQDQLDKIRKTLSKSLGDSSGQALEKLDSRFTAREEELVVEADPDVVDDSKHGFKPGSKIDLDEIITSGNIDKIIGACAALKGADRPDELRRLVDAVLGHPDCKARHMVETLSKVYKHTELLELLVEKIVQTKGINPLIEALKYSDKSPRAMLQLAKGIAEQGTVNHIMRAIAAAPPGQDEAEITWTMEVIGKGTLEQMLDCVQLINAQSPGAVVLATGVINQKDVPIEPLVRTLTAVKDNPQAATVVAVKLVKTVEVPALVSLLEKYVTDKSTAGEIIVAQLVAKVSQQPSRKPELLKAAKYMRNDCVAGKMLAWGIVKYGDQEMWEKAYKRIANPGAKAMVAVAFGKKAGMFGTLKHLGKAGWDLSKKTGEAAAASKEGQEKLNEILTNVLEEALGSGD
ncbi:hypothetical protein [Magnetofaba australis]|uniref:Uncharacterized protein n=1 Tax=Magnetofaba australis IT-1 TaxID=1434232 RepID=A0A1Y2JYW3_9PROT|nr:hypothetical protein [Magnetofaba australis]OSM00085.1 hypothetical protein MAIT1_00509 [Magnetofaba australis IT-1]